MKRLIFDLDGTLCQSDDGNYANAKPNLPLIKKLRSYKDLGYEIVISTSRNMRTFNGVLGKINAITLPVIIDWLNYHGIPYDEIYVGKPWCGFEGFYIDDKAIRPSEFLQLDKHEIANLLNQKK